MNSCAYRIYIHFYIRLSSPILISLCKILKILVWPKISCLFNCLVFFGWFLKKTSISKVCCPPTISCLISIKAPLDIEFSKNCNDLLKFLKWMVRHFDCNLFSIVVKKTSSDFKYKRCFETPMIWVAHWFKRCN